MADEDITPSNQFDASDNILGGFALGTSAFIQKPTSGPKVNGRDGARTTPRTAENKRFIRSL